MNFVGHASSANGCDSDTHGIDFDEFTATFGTRSLHYRPLTQPHIGDSQIKVIAYYLPQFHPIPENNAWWGEGFTEWTNVSKSVPQFRGHYQPHLPGELGFYDLRNKETQRRQIELARRYGIHGFCYYHYWFAGRRILEAPFKQVLDDPTLDFPFCLCWANENWTRRWDGAEHDVLIAQEFGVEDDWAFIADIAPALKDSRYIRVDGRPLLIVYRVALLPDARATAARWREYCRDKGIGDLYLVAAQTQSVRDPRGYGFDAAVEFPPHATRARRITNGVDFYNPRFRGLLYHYPDILEAEKHFEPPDYTVFKCVMPGWDNSARRPGYGTAFVGSTPRLFADITDLACQHAVAHLPENNRFVFVNAWNEWGEGAHLEPDRRDGYAYLEALANTVAKYPCDRSPRVSVIVPVYNTGMFIDEALRSVEAQTYSNLELIVIDDGSTDNTVEVVERFLQARPNLQARLVKRRHEGGHAAIEAGISLASGDVLAILNADDRFDPSRLACCVSAMISTNADLVFSGVEVFLTPGNESENDEAYAANLRARLDAILQYPSMAFAILDSNIAVTTGNFVFRRSLHTRHGGFLSLQLCHDWDFLLHALATARVTYVRQPLYAYRLHASNTYKQVAALAEEETSIVLSRFFDTIEPDAFHALFQDRDYMHAFLSERSYWPFLRASAARLRLRLPPDANQTGSAAVALGVA